MQPITVYKYCRKCRAPFSSSDPNDLVHCARCDHHYRASSGKCGNCHISFNGRRSDMQILEKGVSYDSFR